MQLIVPNKLYFGTLSLNLEHKIWNEITLIMAYIKFFINTPPSRWQEGKLETIYFSYRVLNLKVATPFKIDPKNFKHEKWDEQQIVKGARLASVKQLNDDIQEFNDKLHEMRRSVEKFIEQNLTDGEEVQKDKIRAFVRQRYFPHRMQLDDGVQMPANFISLIDWFLEEHKGGSKTAGIKPLAPNTVKYYTTLKNNISEFQPKLKVTDIDDAWRRKFEKWMDAQEFSESVQTKHINTIRRLCRYAAKNHPVKAEALVWVVKNIAKAEKVSEYPALNIKQLQRLSQAEMPTKRLDDVRDWFLISCYTSFRVSELLQLDESCIKEYQGFQYLEVYEPKNRRYAIKNINQFLKPILEKRGGKFPEKISAQKYNEYLKEACRIAGLTEEVKGGKPRVVEIDGKRKRRKKQDLYPLYELISSHLSLIHI